MTDWTGTAYEALGDAVGIAAVTLLETYIQEQYADLAENYYNMYNGERQWYYDNFQDGGSNYANTERGLLFYVMNTPLQGNNQSGLLYTPQYLPQSNKIIAYSTRALSQNWWQNHAAMYSSTPFTTGYDAFGNFGGGAGEPTPLEFAAMQDDNATYMFRYEEHRKDVYDERTWEWQNQALNFGVKQGNITQSGLATSFRYLDETSGGLADWMATQGNGLLTYSAYRGASYDTAQQLNAAATRGRDLGRYGTSLGVDVRAGLNGMGLLDANQSINADRYS